MTLRVLDCKELRTSAIAGEDRATTPRRSPSAEAPVCSSPGYMEGLRTLSQGAPSVSYNSVAWGGDIGVTGLGKREEGSPQRGLGQGW